MAITQIFDPYARGTGARFGEEVGQGIQALVGHKMTQMGRQRQEQNNYEALIAGGLPEAQARGYSKASPEILRDLFGDVFARYGSSGIPRQQEQPMQEQQMMQPQIGTPGQAQANPQADLLQQLMGQQQQGPMTKEQALMQALKGGRLNGEEGLIDYLKSQELKQPSQQSQPQGMAQQPMAQPKPMQAVPTRTMPNLTGMRPQEKAAAIKAFQQEQALAKKEEQLAKKEALEDRKLKQREQFLSDKETKPVYDEIHKEAKAAKNNDKRLDKMEQLIKNGNLSNPVFASAIKTLGHGIFGFGIDLSSLQHPESQQFEKLSNDFIREAKSIFGSRLTDADLNYYLKTIPNLSMSNEGKAKVIQNMRQFNEATKAKETVMNDIIKQNNGVRPRNLLELVDEKSAPILDALAEKFKSQPEPVVPSAESLPSSLLKALGVL